MDIFTSGSYRHQRLRHADEFRLIRLCANEDHKELRAGIVRARLNSCPSYEAVSYTWATEHGDARLSHRIHVLDGGSTFILQITQNCYQALSRFRQKDAIRMLWVDSICIDQSNLEERSHQVGIMTKIYQKAEKVLIYLGNGTKFDPGSSLRIEYLFDFLEKQHRYRRSTDGSTIADLLDPAKSCEEVVVRDLKILLNHNWFHRIWVIQEVKLAKEAVIFCGPHQLPWKCLELDPFHAVENECTDLIASLPVPGVDIFIPSVLRIRKRPYPRPSDLSDLLIATRKCQATDPRDKVFALLWCQEGANFATFAADYTKSFSEVFREATIHCIHNSQSTKLLSLFSTPIQGVESWVPNFTESPLLLLSSWEEEWRARGGFIMKASNPGEHEYEWPFFIPTNTMNITTTTTTTHLNGFISRLWPNFPRKNDYLSLPRMIDSSNMQLHVFGRQMGTVMGVNHNLMDISQIQKDLGDGHQISYKELNDRFREAVCGPPRFNIPAVFLHCCGSASQVPESYRYMPEPQLLYDIDILRIDVVAKEIETRELAYKAQRRAETSIYCSHILDQFVFLVKEFGSTRSIIFTDNSIGIGPYYVQEGDMVYSTFKATTPLILRRRPNGYSLVGECLLFGNQLILDSHSNACGFARDWAVNCYCKACTSFFENQKDAHEMDFFPII